jgi:phosphopantothenate---cysteine ligase (CTP)
MNILVTAGNTQTPIDRVRCITNIFSGRTGGTIATRAAERGHTVTLLTSHPDVVVAHVALTIRPYKTFDDLHQSLAHHIPGGAWDIIIHAAAVSDYAVTGIFTHANDEFQDVNAGKVKSSHAELWMRMVPTPKLVDRIREPWGFRGVLVKFKLEVGVSEAELLAIAEKSRQQSRADLMSANTLDGMHEWAYVGAGFNYRRVTRAELADYLLTAAEDQFPLAHERL